MCIVERNFPAIIKSIFQNKKNKWLICLLLFTIFFSMYLVTSGKLARSGAFIEFDTLFEIDPPRVIEDMARYDGNHARTIVHPLYVLMINPVGLMINFFTGDAELTARIINSALGACAVVLGFLFFLQFGIELLDALVLSLFFGMTTSHFFLSSIPDTASLAICSLIAMYFVFIRSYQMNKMVYHWWFLAGLFTLAVTTTNFAQTVICFFAAKLIINRKKFLPALLDCAKFVCVVLLVAAALAWIQKMIYPSSIHFLSLADYGNELNYASPLIFQTPRMVVVHQIKNFLMANVIAPNPFFFSIYGRNNPMLTFGTSHNFNLLGWTAVVMWWGLTLYALWEIFQKRDHLNFYLVLGACLLFNFVLHAFYGVTDNRIELFLYTGNLTFLILTPLIYFVSSRRNKIGRFLLVTLLIITTINNIQVMKTIIDIYNG